MSAASRARRPRQAAAQISYAEAEGASDSEEADEPKPPPKKRARAPKATKKGKKPESEESDREGELPCPPEAVQTKLMSDPPLQRNLPRSSRPTPTSGRGYTSRSWESSNEVHSWPTSSAWTGQRSSPSK